MKKLTLGQVRFLMAASAALSLVLLPVSSALNSTALMYAGLGSFVFSAVVWFCFYRCPHCGKRLKQSSSRICPYCGKHL